MVIAGGAGRERWMITTKDTRASSGRVIRRTVTLDAPTHLVLTGRGAHQLAAALNHAARHKGDANGS